MLTDKRIREFKELGSVDFDKINLSEFIQLSEFFTPIIDGDRKEVVLKPI